MGCANAVRSALERVPSVSEVKVVFPDKRAYFSLDPEKVFLQDIVRSVETAHRNFSVGFLFEVEGGSAQWARGKEALAKVKGVKEVKVRQVSEELALLEVFLQIQERTRLDTLFRVSKEAGISLKVPRPKE